MLFNSHEFILVFLPITMLGFYAIGYSGRFRVAAAWLVIASLWFYSHWNSKYLLVLLFSIVFNYLASKIIERISQNQSAKRLFLGGSITVNLGLLGYFKYANFFAQNINSAFATNFNFEHIVLPLAISFFTFQQIAYLIDAYQGKTKFHDFLSYCLFVCFFPQLIAGPIVHPQEMMPQFSKPLTYRFNSENLAIGLTLFSAGLFKKVVFADTAAAIATPIFNAAANGEPIGLIQAWGGALAYTCQLYFDFSGYSDMAIGLGRMFGIKLPLNFNSPYKAANISDFWRRWHITLSNFLRDYIYIPLGGNRKGELRCQFNLLVTMLLGGLWHGAGWTFVLWGGLHGLYLVVHRQWKMLIRQQPEPKFHFPAWLDQSFSCLLTFIAVVFAWVLFRAETLSAAGLVIQGMLGFNGFSTALGTPAPNFIAIASLLLIIWFTPNTQEWMAQYQPALNVLPERLPANPLTAIWTQWQWNPSQKWALMSVGTFLVSLFLLSDKSEFIYFNF